MTEHVAEMSAEELSEQKSVRLAKRDRLLAEGEAYPVSVPITTTIAAVRTKHENLEIGRASCRERVFTAV